MSQYVDYSDSNPDEFKSRPDYCRFGRYGYCTEEQINYSPPIPINPVTPMVANQRRLDREFTEQEYRQWRKEQDYLIQEQD